MKKYLLTYSILLVFVLSACPPILWGNNPLDVSMKKKEMQLVEAISLISKEYNVYFTFDHSLVKDIMVEYETKENRSVEEAISGVLSGTDLKFKLYDKRFVILYQNDEKGLESLKEMVKHFEHIIADGPETKAARRSLKAVTAIPIRDAWIPKARELRHLAMNVAGRVTDQAGEPLIGVNVQVKGTSKGTSTDINGEYTLNDVNENAILVFSYIGYQRQEIPIDGRMSVDVTMLSDAQMLDEVVVVGYGTQKKVNMTGAVDVISSEQLEKRQAPTVSQALQGQTPGLNFSVGNNGFEPGASMSVDIRGIGSLNGGSPFVLIDGFPGSMDNLNPNDIESISVLKDAAASAIYGARAPYGVILITTKSGGKGEKISVNYSGAMMINNASRLPSQINSYDFAKVMNEAGSNSGGRPYDNAAIDRILAYQAGDIDFLRQFMPEGSTHFETMPLNDLRWGHNNYGYANYDWFDEYYGTSLNQRHNLSVNGGTDKTGYYFSAGFVDQNGVLNYGTDTYQRYNLTGKINTAINDWWDIRYETRFSKNPREHFNSKRSHDYSGGFRELARTIPTQSKYDGVGNYSMESKIRWLEDAGTDKYSTTENWQIIDTEFRPTAGWKVNANFAYKANKHVRSNRELAVYEVYRDGSLVPHGETLPNSVEQIQQDNYYWSTNMYTSYEVKLGEHNFLGMVGSQFEYNNTNRLVASKINLIVQDIPSLQTALGDPIASENLTHWSTQGYFGRITYNYNEKYLFEANVRYDGTSRFQEGRRWGFFPSFSVGWNLHRESFWENIEPYINVLKLRASWGQLGNQQVDPYQDIALVPLQTGKLNWFLNYGENRPIGYTGTPRLVSPNLTWETSTTGNIGLNLAFLDNRLQVDFDLFERITDNMIGPSEPVPGVLGSSVPQSNNATLRSRGWETSLRWNHSPSGSAFSYFVNLNVHDVRTTVTDYLNPSGLVSSWYKGKEVGEIWGYTAQDLFQSQEDVDRYLEDVDLSFIYSDWNPGDVKYEDINGDGAVNPGNNSLDDSGDLSIIGNSSPRYQFGLSAGLNWKGFDLSFLVNGTAKRDFMASRADYVYWGLQQWLFIAFSDQHLDYFRDQPGDKYTGLYEGPENINLDAYWPKLYLASNDNFKNRHPSTRYLESAAYLRLQNLQVGYSLPAHVLSKMSFQKLRVYFSGENLFTITGLIRGIDPVAQRGQQGIGMTYRSDRVFSFGVSATL